jgi:nicotinamidase-related amidase
MKNSALLLIDLQQEDGSGHPSMTHIAGIGMDKIVENAQLLIEQARVQDIPIIYTRQINRADGRGLVNREPVDATGSPIYYREGTAAVEIVEKIRPRPRDIVIDKRRQNAFYESELDMVLRGLGPSRRAGTRRRGVRRLRVYGARGAALTRRPTGEEGVLFRLWILCSTGRLLRSLPLPASRTNAVRLIAPRESS